VKSKYYFIKGNNNNTNIIIFFMINLFKKEIDINLIKKYYYITLYFFYFFKKKKKKRKVSSLNINASIDALDQTHGLPQSVIDRSNIVIRKGGLKTIEETFTKASAISQENQQIIDKVSYIIY